jgi:hypothetical protein
MLTTAHNPTLHRRRFGFTEVLLIVGILALGAFVMVNEGRETFGGLVSGVEKVVRG